MFAVIAEDKSDAETLAVLIRRLDDAGPRKVYRKGYGGCAEMLRKGAKQIAAFRASGICSRYVVCYDSDRSDPEIRRAEIVQRIFLPAGLDMPCCALVPIQEIEAWMLADVAAVTQVISGWRPDFEIQHPEHIDDPKEFIERASRVNQRPRYIHAVHNQRIAEYLNLDAVIKKCPSFRPLVNLVCHGRGNVLTGRGATP